MAVQTISENLKKMLQDAIARELQVSIQYMWQHVMWRGNQLPQESAALVARLCGRGVSSATAL